jgi:3-phosphoshikimate 1-carboxyvinyltransferase
VRGERDIVEFTAIPADKSISQRAIILNALGYGQATVRNVLKSDDILNCVQALRSMGVPLEWEGFNGQHLRIQGVGLRGLKEIPYLDLGNSATSSRFLMAVMAGYPYSVEIRGNERLSSRTMVWTVDKLRAMGASTEFGSNADHLPLTLHGRFPLQAVHFKGTVASAQEKNVVLMAGLFAEGTTVYEQLCQSRDHTERMMRYLGIPVRSGRVTEIDGLHEYAAKDITVPGDISSAAFVLTAAILNRQSIPFPMRLKGIGLNPTRTGFLSAIEQMGVNVKVERQSDLGAEPVGDLLYSGGSAPRGARIEGMEFVQSLIDEIPLLALLAAVAEGGTSMHDCSELKDKDTNRLETTAALLRAFGADITITEHSVVIKGSTQLKPAIVDSCNDHRIAMTAAVAASSLSDYSYIRNCRCLQVSYPTFLNDLSVFAEIEVIPRHL